MRVRSNSSGTLLLGWVCADPPTISEWFDGYPETPSDSLVTIKL
jgi:hypothetical protein